jgi:Acyclic terpene utilisation family protein AtuA
VVITGRVADPALFLAALMHHFGWRADDWPMLGRGVAVGHLLECAAQVSGGYLADPGFVEVPDLAHLGFPLAEVSADGCAVITKLPGTGGRVDRLSCTAQLLYEIEDPACYRQPDVTADFSQVRLQELGEHRVRVQGAGGRARPAELKVSLGVREGFVGEGQISYGGPGAVARGRLALDVLRARLDRLGIPIQEQRAELIGVDALYREPGVAGEPREVRLRLAARTARRADAECVAQEVEALYLNGPAAGGGVVLSVREVLAVESVLLPREAVRSRCEMLEL